MQLIIKIIHFFVSKVEFCYSFLAESLWDELIGAERDPDPKNVLLSVIFLLAFSITAFYFKTLLQVIIAIATSSFLLSQLIGIINFNNADSHSDLAGLGFIDILKEMLHSFSMIVFLVVLSNILPKVGHFIMAWIGPYFDLFVPFLLMDLSFNGLAGFFSFEFNWFNYFEATILFLSFTISVVYFLKTKKQGLV